MLPMVPMALTPVLQQVILSRAMEQARELVMAMANKVILREVMALALATMVLQLPQEAVMPPELPVLTTATC